jgi:hypothetical protein
VFVPLKHFLPSLMLLVTHDGLATSLKVTSIPTYSARAKKRVDNIGRSLPFTATT